MAYAAPHIRLSFGGTQADNLEIWSCSHAIIRTADSGATPREWFESVTTQDIALGNAIERFIGDADSRVPNNTKVKWMKLALLDTDGKYDGPPFVKELDWGGAINAPYSPQDALVVTLISDQWRGAGRYNRFYVPTAGPAGTNAWCLSPAEQGAFLASAQEYLEDVNDAMAASGVLGASFVGVVSNVGTGQQRLAVDVMAGRIVDTQRRRRNALTEEYATLPVFPTP